MRKVFRFQIICSCGTQIFTVYNHGYHISFVPTTAIERHLFGVSPNLKNPVYIHMHSLHVLITWASSVLAPEL